MVAIGNQWFWIYEVLMKMKLVIDCYLVKSQELNLGQARLFETTLNVVLP